MSPLTGVARLQAPAPRNFPVFPEVASTMAPEIDRIYLSLIAFAGFFTVALALVLVFFIIRYRAGRVTDRTRKHDHTLRYEIPWILIPTVLALALFAWAAQVYFTTSRPPDDAMTIYVVGKQWMWKVQHPSGRREIDELHVPAGRPVRLVMTSQDVIHSFYVPAFRVKQDVLPGRYTTLWFEATAPGEYHLFCAEYCGTGHSTMRGRIVVLHPADFQNWLSAEAPESSVAATPGAPRAPMAIAGEGAFFRLGCNACHVPNASIRAPRLDGLWMGEVRLRNERTVIADEFYIRESILRPNAKIVAGYGSPSLMPTYEGQVTEEEILELIEFIRSLRFGWPEEYLR